MTWHRVSMNSVVYVLRIKPETVATLSAFYEKASMRFFGFLFQKMSRDVLTVGSTMMIPLLYRKEYSQWVERFMNYLEEQTDGEAMINSIKNDKSMWSDHKKRIQKIDRLARSLLIQGLLNDIYSLIDSNKTTKDLWDALARHMLGSEYCEQDRKAAQNQKDVNEAMRLKKKSVVVTFDPLALIAVKTKVNKSKEKVVASSDSEGSGADDFSELKKITALLAKAFNQRKFYSKPRNNNLRTSSTSKFVNKKQEFVKSDDKKEDKKSDEKKRDMSKVKCYNCKKEGHFAKDCKKEKEINANMVFMAQIKKVLSDSETSSSSADEKISEVSYYLSESKSESEYETSEYYDNTTTYGLFMNHNDDQEIFHECENFLENIIESQIDHNESVVDHNDSKGVDKLIIKFNKKIVKCQKRIEKANQQSKDFENQNKDLQDKYDVLKNQATTFEINNKELNEQLKVLIEKNDDLLAQTKNKDKKNRLMRIDELHKFSDGTLTDVRTALDDRLKGIRMQYLPQSIWKKSDKDRGSAMIQAIDKRLKTRRIMRSLE
nr:putative zinc finger, CCHC-type [Tanacetum cinerariifolium]